MHKRESTLLKYLPKLSGRALLSYALPWQTNTLAEPMSSSVTHFQPELSQRPTQTPPPPPYLPVSPRTSSKAAVVKEPWLSQQQRLPFSFDSGVSLFAKRTPRPFPPPFLYAAPGLTDPQEPYGIAHVDGERMHGTTNGDDAVFASSDFIAVNDGVSAWATRPRGHAGLWSRLIIHYWSAEIRVAAETQRHNADKDYCPDPIRSLQKAYERAIAATTQPQPWLGTTTVTGAQLFYKKVVRNGKTLVTPSLYVTNIGDSRVMVIRPTTGEIVYSTKDQYHCFDCPKQLGTNSGDTPVNSAVMDTLSIEEGDVVLAMSDGVTDNLWADDIVDCVVKSIKKWDQGLLPTPRTPPHLHVGAGDSGGIMQYVAEELMKAARSIALDGHAICPFTKHAMQKGYPMYGGKLDDISVVAARCSKHHD